MSELEQITIDERVQAAVDKALNSADAQMGKAAEVVRQQIAFYDRLLVLSGATITLSFTAIGNFHSHRSQGLLHVPLLVTSLGFLVYVILACLSANWLTIASLTHRTVILSEVSLAVRGTLLRQYARDNQVLPGLGLHKTGMETAAESKGALATADKLEHFSGRLGFSAQVGIAVAYLLLFVFISQNI